MMTTPKTSLVTLFDEIVACSDVLNAGVEGVFGDYITRQFDFFTKQMTDLKTENNKLKGESEAKDIKLKLSRNSLQEQMNECGKMKEQLKEYEKQFTILKVLLNSDEKLSQLNEAERRSLALLKKTRTSASPGFLNDSGDPSDVSINVTDATDLDDDEGSVQYGAKWKRRRTASAEWTLDSSLTKKRRSADNKYILDENKDSLLRGEVHMTPPLQRHFKKPPPNKNRRKPSKGHLQRLNSSSPPPPTIPPFVPPLELPCHYDDSPIPSAPSEQEVALVNNGLLPVYTHEGPSPVLQYSPMDTYSTSIQPQPPTPPISSVSTRLYPALLEECDEREEIHNYEETDLVTPVRVPNSHPLETRTQSDINLNRRHVFFTKTLMKPETCQVCKKKVGFGRNCSKCKDCRAVCHVECKERVPLPCVPSVHTPKRNQKDSDLAAFCPHTIPRVPSLIVHCVKEIENRGMTHVGIYRVPGSERSIKELKERLLKAKGNPNLEKVEDINVVCGCLKQFLINLREPLITHKMHPFFMQAMDERSEEMALAGLLEAIAQLPPCNKDTLAFLILHLQKVASYSEANKMPTPCLARVFGPTIVGSCNSDPNVMLKDVQKQQMIIERLLNISPDYWRQYLSPEDNPDPQSPSPNQVPFSNPSSPPFTSPSTPELMPVPQSPFLGPCHSPKGRAFSARTPVVTRSVSALSNPPSSVSRSVKKGGGNFFAAIN